MLENHNGERLRAYLRSKKIRINSFAERLNMSRANIYIHLERHKFGQGFKEKVIRELDLPGDYFDDLEDTRDQRIKELEEELRRRDKEVMELQAEIIGLLKKGK